MRKLGFFLKSYGKALRNFSAKIEAHYYFGEMKTQWPSSGCALGSK